MELVTQEKLAALVATIEAEKEAEAAEGGGAKGGAEA
jgi:hypothetical protein